MFIILLVYYFSNYAVCPSTSFRFVFPNKYMFQKSPNVQKVFSGILKSQSTNFKRI